MTTRFSTMHALLLTPGKVFAPTIRMTAPGAGTAAHCRGTLTAQRPRISAHNYRHAAAHHSPGREEHSLPRAAFIVQRLQGRRSEIQHE